MKILLAFLLTFISVNMPVYTAHQILGFGDSLTYGYQQSLSNQPTEPSTYLNQLDMRAERYTGLTWETQNWGVSGNTVEQMAARVNSQIISQRDGAKEQVVVLWGGTNNLASGNNTLANLKTQFESLCSQIKAAGFKLVVLDMLPRTDVAYNANFEADRANWNNTYLPSKEGILFDKLVKVSTIPELQDTTNTKYYADLVHITSVGAVLVARKVWQGIGALQNYPYPPDISSLSLAVNSATSLSTAAAQTTRTVKYHFRRANNPAMTGAVETVSTSNVIVQNNLNPADLNYYQIANESADGAISDYSEPVSKRIAENVLLLSNGGTAEASSRLDDNQAITPDFCFDGYRKGVAPDGSNKQFYIGRNQPYPQFIGRNLTQKNTFYRFEYLGGWQGDASNSEPTENVTTTSFYQAQDFAFEVSNDKINWNQAGATITGNDKMFRSVSVPNGATGKYVRLKIITPSNGVTTTCFEIAGYGVPVPPIGTTTGLAIDGNFNITSDADAAADHYHTQYRDDAGGWTDFSSTAREFVGNQNLSTSVGTHQRQIRRKGVDDSGVESANWSEIATVNYTILPPPNIVAVNPVPWAKIGDSYSLQLRVYGGSGSGSWSKTGGNLPAEDFSSGGIITIPVIGNSDYTLTARYTDASSGYDEISLTIPVTQYDWISLCHKRPMPRKEILTQRIFKPLFGDEEVIEDAPRKYQFTIQNLYIGRSEGDALRDFLDNHRKREKFYWYNPDRQETRLVKRIDAFSEEEMLSYGGFEITLEDA